jgi:hypothetical protein
MDTRKKSRGRTKDEQPKLERKDWPTAMAFYHGDGLVPSYTSAKAFAGQGGRVATLPDIWQARVARLQDKLAMEPGWSRVGAPWDTYYTTTSAEYAGLSRHGNLIAIVAHGNGPMHDMDGMVKAYHHQFSDKSRDIRGGRISREEFLRLESGAYGEVAIVDLGQYVTRYEYPFISDISHEQAMSDPMLQARLGARWWDFVAAQKAVSDRWHEAKKDEENERLKRWGVKHPRPENIFGVSDNANFNYTSLLRYPDFLKLATGDGAFAIAHLLSVGGVMAVSYSGRDADYTGVTSDLGLHAWYDGTRFVGVRAGAEVTDIHPGPNDLRASIRKHWKRLGKPTGSRVRARPFYRLDDDGEFTLRQDDDSKVMQSGDPEFKVNGAEEVGRGEFVTEIEGYHGFFRYCPKDVRKIAPPNANAFTFTTDGEIVSSGGNPTHHKIGVAFYHADVDTTLRLPTEDEILKDFDLTMKLTLDSF